MIKNISFLLITIVVLAACNTNTKTNETKATSAQDSMNNEIKSQIDKIVDDLAPPDSDYTGEFFQKYESGVVKTKGFFRFGKRHGQWFYFYPNGFMWSEAFYDAGKMNGHSKVYYENSKLYYEGDYKQDKPVGVWFYNDTTGTPVLQVTYDTLGKIIEQKKLPVNKK